MSRRSQAQFGVVVLGLAAWTLAAGAARGAPPRLDFFFPAGVERGTTAVIEAHGSFDSWPVRVHCDRPGVHVRPSEKKGELAVEFPADTQPGVCWLRLHDAQGATTARPLFVGLVSEVVETEPNNDPPRAQKLSTLPSTVNGRFESAGDVDLYAVSLDKGQTLVASLEAARTLGSPVDGVLQVLSPDGFVVAHNDDDHGLDPQLVVTAPAAGTYFVRALAFPAEPNSTIGLAGGANFVYRLTLTTGEFTDHAWPLAMTERHATEVRLFGWNQPEPARRLAVTPATEGKPASVHSAGVANFASIAVEPHSVVAEPQPGDTGDLGVLMLPVTISGRISAPREVDLYKVHLTKSETVQAQTVAREIDSPLDAVLTVFDAQGKPRERVDDVPGGRDAALAFTAPEDGEYRFSVTDLHRRGGWRFVYLLRLVRPQPDYRISVSADAFTAVAGKPLEIAVAIDRAGGFAEEIEVGLAGLPAEASVPPSRSLKDGESARMVKLVITVTAPWSGPVQILGRSMGDVRRTRYAEAARVPPRFRTRDLWLTVTPVP